MRLVVQRVISARVEVAGEVVGAIDRPGLLILAGVTHDDQPVTVERLAEKVWTLRISMVKDRVRRKTRRFWWSASSRSTPTSARAGVRRGARQRHVRSASL